MNFLSNDQKHNNIGKNFSIIGRDLSALPRPHGSFADVDGEEKLYSIWIDTQYATDNEIVWSQCQVDAAELPSPRLAIDT